MNGLPLVSTLIVLFGGGVSAVLLGVVIANAYFLPGPPPQWSLRGGVAVAVFGATVTGLSVPLAILGEDGSGIDATIWTLVGGVAIYVVGLTVLEIRSRPDAEW